MIPTICLFEGILLFFRVHSHHILNPSNRVSNLIRTLYTLIIKGIIIATKTLTLWLSSDSITFLRIISITGGWCRESTRCKTGSKVHNRKSAYFFISLPIYVYVFVCVYVLYMCVYVCMYVCVWMCCIAMNNYTYTYACRIITTTQ